MSHTRIHASMSQIAFLGASCMMFSLLELSIPRFVPFFRLGLSNLPLMLALALGLDLASYFRLMLIRLLAQAVVGGTLLSYVFVLSLASALASGLAMWGLSRLRSLSFVGVSMGGAFCGNLAQCLAGAVFLGPNALGLFAPVAGLGLATSTALGLAANRFVRGSSFVEAFRSGEPALPPAAGAPEGSGKRRAGASWKAALVVGVMLAVLLFDQLWWRAAALPAVWIAEKAAGGRPRPLRSLAVVAGVTALSLLSPFGEVLARVGGFPVTAGALEAGLERSLLLCASLGLGDLLLRVSGFRGGRALGRVFAYVGVFREGFARNKKTMPLFEAADRTLAEAYLGVCQAGPPIPCAGASQEVSQRSCAGASHGASQEACGKVSSQRSCAGASQEVSQRSCAEVSHGASQEACGKVSSQGACAGASQGVRQREVER